MVGVSSSPPGSQWAGRMAKRLICSGRDSVLLAVCTAAPMAARTAGWLARTAGAGSVMACWVAKRAAVSGSSAISAAM
jgi:hypothetical protein